MEGTEHIWIIALDRLSVTRFSYTLSRLKIRLLKQVAADSSETYYLPFKYSHIHCLVFSNAYQAFINVDIRNPFCIQQFNDTSLFHRDFHIRRHFTKFPLSWNLYERKQNELCLFDRTVHNLLSYQQHL